MLQGDHAIFVDQVMGTSRLVAASAVGEMFPLHCTANGKALLSRLPRERCDRLLAGPLQRFTAATITERPHLDDALAEVRRSGIAWDLGEHTEDICAVGSAFADSLGRDFALSMPVPESRFAAKRDQLAAALNDAMAEVLTIVSGAKR